MGRLESFRAVHLRWSLTSPAAVVVVIVLVAAASSVQLCEARNFDMVLSRFKGKVDTVCVDNNDTRGPTTFDNADVMLVGPKTRLTAGGHKLCVSSPTLVLATGSKELPFVPLDALPSVIASSSFVSSIWRSTNSSDVVTFTAANDVPERPLTVEGAPVPVDLAPANSTQPAAQSQTTLPPAPASSFNLSVELMSEVKAYIARFYTASPNTRGVKAAAIVKYDSLSSDGEFDVAYIIFRQNPSDGSVAAVILSVSYVESLDDSTISVSDAAATASGTDSTAGSSGGNGNGNGGSGRRRLLQKQGGSSSLLRGGRVGSKASGSRSLLQYGYYGGSDKAPVGASTLTCVLIVPTPPGCYTWSCRYRCY